jgi:glycosyltransferase involved in cell wall biosynthesis
MTNQLKPRISVAIILESTLGGTRKYCYDMLTGIDRSVCDVTFIYSSYRADPQFFRDVKTYEERGDVTLKQVRMVREIHPWFDLISLVQLWWLFVTHRYDVVHLHSSKAGFLGRIAMAISFRRTAVLYHPHMMAFNIKPWYGYLEKFASLFTDIIIADSPSEKQLLIDRGIINGNKIRVIDSGIDVSGISVTPKTDQPASPVPVIGAVARLTYPKDPFTFIDAAKLLSDAGIACRFVWVGDGELMEEAQKRVRMLGLDRFVSFAGWQFNPLEWIASFDIFIHSSGYESFGYVIAEAMALAKPVVGSNVTGVRDLIQEGKTGYLFEYNNAEQMADRIKTLITDRTLASEMGERARVRVEQYFTLDRMILDIQTLYQEKALRAGG